MTSFPFLSRSQALISASRLRQNVTLLAARSGVPVAVPVKANAYGHGLGVVAAALRGHPDVWGFAVAQPQEAAALRGLGVTEAVLLLAPADVSEWPELVRLGVQLTVSTAQEVSALPAGARAHLKIETGMNRTGARPQQALELAQQLAERGQLAGIATHFASADSPELGSAHEQLKLFQQTVRQILSLDSVARLPYPPQVHSANGAAVLALGRIAGMTLARPGLALYGYPPAHLAGVLPLWGALRWRARVGAVHPVYAGERVSYGGLFTAPYEMQVATVQVGYADGYPRAATLRAQAVIAGQRRAVLGRVCMDQLMVDITGLEVQVGDWVELLDAEQVSVSDLAAWGELIEYELLTGLGGRIERVLVD